MKPPPTVAELALSDAMTPSGAPLPKLSRVARGAPRLRIGDEAGDRSAGRRQDADRGADDRGADHVDLGAPHEADGLQEAEARHPLRALFEMRLVAHHEVDEDGDAVETDEGGNDRDAAVEVDRAERVADVASDDGRAHRGEEEAECAAHQAEQRVALGERGDKGEAEDRQPEILDRTELQRDRRQWWREEEEGQRARQPADDGRDAGDRDREVAVALLGHRIAVHRGRDRGGRAGRVDEDGGIGAAVDRPRIDRAERDEPRGRVHGEGEGNEHRHGHGRREAGEGADDGAGENASERQQQVIGRQCRQEGVEHRRLTSTRCDRHHRARQRRVWRGRVRRAVSYAARCDAGPWKALHPMRGVEPYSAFIFSMLGAYSASRSARN